jgi:hypothetical protein
LFNSTGSLINGARDAADFVRRSFQDARLKVAFGNTGGDSTMRSRRRALQTEATAATTRAKRNASAEPSSSRRQTCWETDSATGNRNGDIKKRSANGGATALIAADPARESRRKLWSRGTVLQGSGTRLRIRQHVPSGIDDGDTSASGLAFLSSDVGEGLSAVGFDPVSEESGLLDEIALNF